MKCCFWVLYHMGICIEMKINIEIETKKINYCMDHLQA